MSISNRIIAGFAAITVLLVALGLYALSQVGAVSLGANQIVERDIATMAQVDRVTTTENEMRDIRVGAVVGYLAGGTAASDRYATWQGRANEVAAALDQLRTTANGYEKTAVAGQRAGLWQQLATSVATAETRFGALRAESTRQFEAMRDGDRATVLHSGEAVDREHEALAAALRDARAVLDESVRAGRGVTQSIYDRTRYSIFVGLIVAILLSIGIAWTIRRSITAPLHDFMDFVGRVGQGDLGGATAATGGDELGKLGSTLNMMVGGLREIAGQNRQATENLNAAATEIRASTQEQAASVEEQLAAVQETAATVDEITHSGVQISRRAQEIIAAAQATAQISQSGIAAVDDTAHAMDAIREQAEAVAATVVSLSQKTQAIGDIIATVNDVSERSHLLALNASIEAAAAGENGRSFAIVAAEMKTLADQAKAATRNVRALLGDIQRGINSSVMLTEEAVKRVASGKERTDASQAAIEELGSRIQDSVQTFQQIVASTNQQQIGIEQVTVALQNIRQASQQAAASTRQLDQAAGDLTQLSRTLVGLTERYRL